MIKKKNSFAAAAAAVALGLTSTLAVAMPASAEDFYVVDSDLGVEDASSDRGYPDNTWFTGSSTTGTQTTTDAGIELTGRTMLLYGADEIALDGDLFIDLVQSAAVDADGDWFFQLPVYFDNATPDFFTTFRPASGGAIPGELDSEWTTSSALPGVPGGSTLTLQDIADLVDSAVEAELQPALLAYGVLVDEGWDALTLRSVTFDGDTSFFTAEVEDDDEPADETDDADDDTDEAPPATAVEAEATFTG